MRSPKLRKRTIILSVIVVLVFGGIGFLWATSGNSGQIDPTPLSKQPTKISDKTLNGKYVSLRFSGKYIQQTLPAKDDDLEIYMLNADTVYNKNIAVAVSQLAGGSLNSNSAYNLRASQPTVYSSRKIKVGDDVGIVWIKNDGREQTVIIPHGSKVAVLAFTTEKQSDNLQTEVDTLLQTFVWK